MISDIQAKQANPILSGMVPRNYWTDGTLRADWPFATYERQIASIAKVEYIDHTLYSVKKFGAMGQEKSKTFYPIDETHTNAGGAKSMVPRHYLSCYKLTRNLVNAETFIEAAKCRRSAITRFLGVQGERVKTDC